MNIKWVFPIKTGFIIAILAVTGLQPAVATLIVDRGLPTANLNNAAGANRSNVAWDFNPPESYISGDDFSLPNLSGGTSAWRIDKVRVWAIAGNSGATPFALGDRYDTISLFLGNEGVAGTTIDRVKTASISAGGHATDNADVIITPITYSTGVDYQGSSKSFIQIWQVDFNNLGLFDPGALMFGVDGVGPLGKNWFNHASNAALSGSPQDGADNQMRWYTGSAMDASIALGGLWDSNGYGWDKSSDHNIQVFATQVPVPTTLALLSLGLAGFGFVRQRRGD